MNLELINKQTDLLWTASSHGIYSDDKSAYLGPLKIYDIIYTLVNKKSSQFKINVLMINNTPSFQIYQNERFLHPLSYSLTFVNESNISNIMKLMSF